MTKLIRQHAGRRGFTLIEILVGLVIATMILGAAAGVFVTALDAWRRGNQSRRVLQTAQALGHTIERQLRSALPPDTKGEVVFWGMDLSDGERMGHEITFLSSAPPRFPRSSARSDVCEVTFRFDPSEEGAALTMRVDPTPDEIPDDGGVEVNLSEEIASFEVLYFDEIEWLPVWEETEAPVAVQFTVHIKQLDDAGREVGAPYELKRLVWIPRSKDELTASEAAAQGAAESAP